jgi:hypothetical protein
MPAVAKKPKETPRQALLEIRRDNIAIFTRIDAINTMQLSEEDRRDRDKVNEAVRQWRQSPESSGG